MKHAEGPNGENRLDREAAGPRINLWHVILRYKWTIVAATVVGGGLGYLYYLKQTPIYASSAQVLVTNTKRMSLPMEGIDASAGYEDNLATHSLLIRSPLLVEKAIKEHNLDSLRSLAGASNPVQVIISGISVGRADGGAGGEASADVLELRFTGPNIRKSR
ncbi:MAG: Wzz/FepE/Etk N-terminal domain-containing protein [Planctomycetota bacterium]